MKFYHVAQGFYFLGNRGLKCEHMGGIMVDEKDCPAWIIVYYCVSALLNKNANFALSIQHK